MTNAHWNSHQYLKSEMITSQKDGDDGNAEKNETKGINLDNVWPLQKRHSSHTANCILLHNPLTATLIKTSETFIISRLAVEHANTDTN